MEKMAINDFIIRKNENSLLIKLNYISYYSDFWAGV